MRKAILLLAVLALAAAAAAQEVPKFQLFGGFSFVRIDAQGQTGSTFVPGSTLKYNYPGFVIEPQYNFNKWLGFKADVGYHGGTPLSLTGDSFSSARMWEYMVGPTIFHQSPHARPYVHGLFGGNHVSSDADAAHAFPGTTSSAFAFDLGGGLDLKITNAIWIRVGQGDWLRTSHVACSWVDAASCLGLASHQNNFRFSTGVVIDWGAR